MNTMKKLIHKRSAKRANFLSLLKVFFILFSNDLCHILMKREREREFIT